MCVGNVVGVQNVRPCTCNTILPVDSVYRGRGGCLMPDWFPFSRDTDAQLVSAKCHTRCYVIAQSAIKPTST